MRSALGLYASSNAPSTTSGIKSIPQIGQSPGSGNLTCGSIEQVQISLSCRSTLCESCALLPLPMVKRPRRIPTEKMTMEPNMILVLIFILLGCISGYQQGIVSEIVHGMPPQGRRCGNTGIQECLAASEELLQSFPAPMCMRSARY